MQYSDTSGKTGLIQECEFLTNLGDGIISGDTTLLATFTRLINARYHKVWALILESQDDWDLDDSNHTDYAIATTPLAANQRDYSFPASLDILKLKRVDLTYDGTNYYRARKIDSGIIETGFGNTTTEDADYNTTDPAYDLKANTIWVYPLATASQVTAGAEMRIEFLREPDEFTTADTSQEPGIDEPFHRMLAIGASLDYAVAKGLDVKNDLAALYQDYEARITRYYGKKSEDQALSVEAQYGMTDFE